MNIYAKRAGYPADRGGLGGGGVGNRWREVTEEGFGSLEREEFVVRSWRERDKIDEVEVFLFISFFFEGGK